MPEFEGGGGRLLGWGRVAGQLIVSRATSSVMKDEDEPAQVSRIHETKKKTPARIQLSEVGKSQEGSATGTTPGAHNRIPKPGPEAGMSSGSNQY